MPWFPYAFSLCVEFVIGNKSVGFQFICLWRVCHLWFGNKYVGFEFLKCYAEHLFWAYAGTGIKPSEFCFEIWFFIDLSIILLFKCGNCGSGRCIFLLCARCADGFFYRFRAICVCIQTPIGVEHVAWAPTGMTAPFSLRRAVLPLASITTGSAAIAFPISRFNYDR